MGFKDTSPDDYEVKLKEEQFHYEMMLHAKLYYLNRIQYQNKPYNIVYTQKDPQKCSSRELVEYNGQIVSAFLFMMNQCYHGTDRNHIKAIVLKYVERF